MKPKARAVSGEEIRRAAEIIRAGGLVAFPTETVYGLGANALDAEAVARIYAAKRRPAASPLIVHVESLEQARSLAADWPKVAEILSERFWPGPLTMVVPKTSRIPDTVTAGLPTVGLRMPDHRVALALIREAGVPIAAPSANLFMELSPTEAGHVSEELRAAVDCVLDGGAAPVGIESTVVSLTRGRVTLLRPGMVSRTDIETVAGPLAEAGVAGSAHPAPGMHRKHYAPATPVLCVSGGQVPESGRGAYLQLTTPAPAARVVRMPADAIGYASRLYGVLHALDREGWDWIAVEEPPGDPEWSAIRDRLHRAAAR